MSRRVPPIAHIRLARSLPRLLAAPALLLVAGGAGLAAASMAAGPGAIGLAAVGAFLVVVAFVGAFMLVSVRVEVDEADGIILRWLGGHRSYPLARGPVTRVTLRGRDASRLRPRLGAFGWALGPARLRRDEPIEVVRLMPTATAIVLPTERGRLAIAPAAEDRLLAALATAARARHRLEALARHAPPPVEEAPATTPATPPAQAAPAVPQVRLLTGVQRAILEERLVLLRAEAAGAAEEARRVAAEEAAAAAAAAEAQREAEERERRYRATLRGRLQPRPPRWLHLLRPGRRAAWMVAPTLVAGALAGLAVLTDRLPLGDPERLRPVALALVLGGPATLVAAVVARVWWPRLVGIVVASGLAALLIIGRGFLGLD